MGEAGKLGQMQAFKNKWIGQKDASTLIRIADAVEDVTQRDLLEIKSSGTHPNEETIKALKKRKLVDLQRHQTFKVCKGPEFALSLSKLATDLTADLLFSHAWSTQKFKTYNFEACGPQLPGGHLHPLLKVREEFRQIFFEMGFTEMPTNNFVESSFWNFDTLFQPQQHPSRDAHDTFFLRNRQRADKSPLNI